MDLIRQAEAGGADLLVLPEGILARDIADPDIVLKTAQPLDGPFMTQVLEASRRAGLTLMICIHVPSGGTRLQRAASRCATARSSRNIASCISTSFLRQGIDQRAARARRFRDHRDRGPEGRPDDLLRSAVSRNGAPPRGDGADVDPAGGLGDGGSARRRIGRCLSRPAP